MVAALQEMPGAFKRTATDAAHARQSVTDVRVDAEGSGDVVKRAVEAMGAIHNSALEVSKIIGVIDEIAFQTSLLALNAGVEAARAGKHIYLQKPASLTIAEGRILSNVVQKSGVVFQIGSQQRSSEQFRFAAELVRNGRIGALKKVYVGLPGDPGGNPEPEMPVPDTLDYDRWLGSTPEVYYTENRVHPQNSYERPGWLRCEQFGAGMITGWGSHHIDAAHWAMDTELTGPVEVWGHADFPASGLWDVHGIFKTEALYQNGVHMVVSNELPNGIRFEGSEGWLFVTRGNYRASASDPVNADGTKPLDASNPDILTSVIGPLEKHLMIQLIYL